MPAASASPSVPTSASASADPADGSDEGGSPEGGGEPDTGPSHGDGPPAAPCGTGRFATGSWGEPGEGGTATSISGLAVDGDADCVRLRIRFDGPAPGYSVTRQLTDNETRITFDRGNAPTSPLPGDDVVQPGLELLAGALVAWRRAGVGAHVVHGFKDVAVRPATDRDHITLYFRTAQPDDTARGPVQPGGEFSFGGAPADGLVLITDRTYVASPEVVIAHGYVRPYYVDVTLKVYEPGGGPLACGHIERAERSNQLFSWFEVSCEVDSVGPHRVRVTAGDALVEYVVDVG